MVICKEPNCELRAFYNFENDEWKCLYCNEHKKEGMVYLKKRRICIDEYCKKNANFNFEDDKYPDYCSIHKKEGMIDIKNKRCSKENCDKRPFFNLPDKIGGLYCFDHKLDKMINVCTKKCLQKECEVTPKFNYDGKKNGIYCSQHQLENMVNVQAIKCKNNCGTQLRSIKYKGYCVRCFINLFPNEKISRNYKVKENHMTNFIKKYFKDEVMIFDKTVGGCSLRRPDCYIDKFTHIIIIECDENQHRDTSCENKRTMELFQDFCNRPIVFIRFNPDTYINENGKKVLSSFKYHKTLDVPMIRNKEEWDNRLKILKNTIVKWLKNIPKKEITIEKLFFDN